MSRIPTHIRLFDEDVLGPPGYKIVYARMFLIHHGKYLCEYSRYPKYSFFRNEDIYDYILASDTTFKPRRRRKYYLKGDIIFLSDVTRIIKSFKVSKQFLTPISSEAKQLKMLMDLMEISTFSYWRGYLIKGFTVDGVYVKEVFFKKIKTSNGETMIPIEVNNGKYLIKLSDLNDKLMWSRTSDNMEFISYWIGVIYSLIDIRGGVGKYAVKKLLKKAGRKVVMKIAGKLITKYRKYLFSAGVKLLLESIQDICKETIKEYAVHKVVKPHLEYKPDVVYKDILIKELCNTLIDVFVKAVTKCFRKNLISPTLKNKPEWELILAIGQEDATIVKEIKPNSIAKSILKQIQSVNSNLFENVVAEFIKYVTSGKNLDEKVMKDALVKHLKSTLPKIKID